MMAFELLEPGSLKEAIALLDPDDPTYGRLPAARH